MVEPKFFFEDNFDSNFLDDQIWIGTHLPHWSSRAATSPSYKISAGHLELFIDHQQPWCPEFDGVVRVSNLQTAVAGAQLGSAQAQHRYKPGLIVREEQTPDYRALLENGRLEVRAKIKLTADSVAALWAIGLEERPEDSGELCVFEIKSENVRPTAMKVGLGTKAYFDSRLTTDFAEFEIAQPGEFHEYAVTKTNSGLTFEIDGTVIAKSSQIYDYPLQLMLGVYETSGDPKAHPSMIVDYVRLLPVEG